MGVIDGECEDKDGGCDEDWWYAQNEMNQ